jgi:hypothetical protein
VEAATVDQQVPPINSFLFGCCLPIRVKFTTGSFRGNILQVAALTSLPPEEYKRQQVIFEFLMTEESYVKDLQLIVEVKLGLLI